jgi:hypothetical protein
MKRPRIITATALLACAATTHPAHAQRSTATASARYAQINREVGRYTVVKRKFSGYSPNGGTLRAYLLHGSPRKMVAIYYGHSGRAVEEYYFWNSRLFFVLRATFTDGEPPGKEKRTQENRFYFSDSKLVRWQQDRKLMPVASTEAKDYEEHTLAIAREFLQTVRS